MATVLVDFEYPQVRLSYSKILPISPNVLLTISRQIHPADHTP